MAACPGSAAGPKICYLEKQISRQSVLQRASPATAVTKNKGKKKGKENVYLHKLKANELARSV